MELCVEPEVEAIGGREDDSRGSEEEDEETEVGVIESEVVDVQMFEFVFGGVTRRFRELRGVGIFVA